jgi:hypothetical protein
MPDVAEVERARELAQGLKRDFPGAGRIGRTGRHTMRVPASVFFGAIDGNGGVQGDGRTVWDDPEWCRDVTRLHPECAVAYSEPQRVFALGAVRVARAAMPRNRFGRVSWRKVYANAAAGAAAATEPGAGAAANAAAGAAAATEPGAAAATEPGGGEG